MPSPGHRAAEQLDFVWREELCVPRLDPLFPTAGGGAVMLRAVLNATERDKIIRLTAPCPLW